MDGQTQTDIDDKTIRVSSVRLQDPKKHNLTANLDKDKNKTIRHQNIDS